MIDIELIWTGSNFGSHRFSFSFFISLNRVKFFFLSKYQKSRHKKKNLIVFELKKVSFDPCQTNVNKKKKSMTSDGNYKKMVKT